MDDRNEFSAAYTDFDAVELGIVVNLGTLREVLRQMSIDGRRWWVASDPEDAFETGSITIGHGDQNCMDRLNTLYHRIPVVSNEMPRAGTDRLVLLLDPSYVTAEEPGFYIENGRITQDCLEDFVCFFGPIKRALIARMQSQK
jgi:hypothetical protein